MRINQILVFNSVYSSYLKITVFVNLKLVSHTLYEKSVTRVSQPYKPEET